MERSRTGESSKPSVRSSPISRTIEQPITLLDLIEQLRRPMNPRLENLFAGH
jgi:hypothetical protein